jgi:hypothetical protein
MADAPDRAPRRAIASKAEAPSTLKPQVNAAFHKAIAKERDVRHALPAASDLTTRSAVSHLDDHTRAELEAENRRLVAALKRHLQSTSMIPETLEFPTPCSWRVGMAFD